MLQQACKGRITLMDNLDHNGWDLLWVSVGLSMEKKDYAGTGSALGRTHWRIMDHLRIRIWINQGIHQVAEDWICELRIHFPSPHCLNLLLEFPSKSSLVQSKISRPFLISRWKPLYFITDRGDLRSDRLLGDASFYWSKGEMSFSYVAKLLRNMSYRKGKSGREPVQSY